MLRENIKQQKIEGLSYLQNEQTDNRNETLHLKLSNNSKLCFGKDVLAMMGINFKLSLHFVVFSIILLPIIFAATFNRNNDIINTFKIDYENDQFLMNGEPFR